MAALTAVAWGDLPERVPVHWNADGWASRPVAVAMTPLILLGVSVLLAVVPLLDPRRAGLQRSAKAYLAAWIRVAVLLTATHAVVLFAAGSGDLPVILVILVLTGGLLMVVGNYLGKTRSNWFVGIRTPWTLSSERSWSRTHRLGGRMLVLLFAASIASGLLLPTQVAIWVQLAGLAAVGDRRDGLQLPDLARRPRPRHLEQERDLSPSPSGRRMEWVRSSSRWPTSSPWARVTCRR